MAREVKKRVEWALSPDIQGRLSELETLQEQVKHSEKVVLTGHDYNNILDFFKKDLRLEKGGE